MSHNGVWGDSFHKGFSDNEKRTDALWLVTERWHRLCITTWGSSRNCSILHCSVCIYIRTCVCVGCTALLDPILQRKNGTHKLYYTLCYWHNEHNQYVCTKWLQYVEVNTATINKEYTLLFNMISSSAVHMTCTHSVTQCVSMECIR